MVQDARATMGTGGALVGRNAAPLGRIVMIDERTLDLAGLIKILRRRLKLIVATVATLLAVAILYIAITPATYTASSKVLIDPRKKHTVENEVVPSGIGDNFALVDSQVKVILSDAVLRPVVIAQHLATDPEFGARMPGLLSSAMKAITGLFSPAKPEIDNQEEKALEELADRLKVKRDDQTYVIDIAVASESPAKAARLAQAIAQSYLTDQSQDKVRTTQRISTLMDGQLATLRQRLLDAERNVQEFRAANNLQESQGELIDTRQLEGLNQRLVEARADEAQAAAKNEQLQKLLRQGIEPEMLDNAVASQTIMSLRQQYAVAARKEAILGASLLPSHPQFKQVHSEVERLRKLIRDEVERIAAAVKLDYEVAKRRRENAESVVSASRVETDINDSAHIKLRDLQREADTTRAVYESYLSRVKEMNEAERIYTADARIISPAAIPDAKSWPKKSLILALALVFGCGLGGSLALTAEHLDRRIHTPNQLLAATGLNALVSIPTLTAEKGLLKLLPGRASRRATFYDAVLEVLEGGSHSSFRNAVLRLLSQLLDFDTMGQPRVVLVTSSQAGEGKSALALSLAVAAASSGIRTLLIDANSANPALTKMIGEPAAKSKLDERIITDPQLGLSFLSIGTDDPQLAPARWSDRAALTDELSRITSEFDLTLVDAGLLRWERNARSLITAAQAILFLTRASATSQDAAGPAAADLLQMASGRRCAAVLTMTGDENV